MAEFDMDSNDIKTCLFSLSNRLRDAINWVGEQERKIKIALPDELWSQRGENPPLWFDAHCGTSPRLVTCLDHGLAEDRGEVEILLAVLKTKAE